MPSRIGARTPGPALMRTTPIPAPAIPHCRADPQPGPAPLARKAHPTFKFNLNVVVSRGPLGAYAHG